MSEKKTQQQEVQEQQQLLFARQQTKYAWKSVQQVERGNVIVVMQQEVRVLGLRQDSDCLQLSYTDPSNGTKTEQLFTITDYVYARL